MNTRTILMGGLSALVLGGSTVGCTAGGSNRLASASSRDAGAEARAAAGKAEKAAKLLARHDAAGAVGFAEGAVALAPRDADYRYVLGQSYLQAGRFASARTAFADTLELQPANAKAALNLSLAEIATGDWGAARRTLAAYGGIIPAADRGLALALSGDPAGAVAVLKETARSPGSTPKVRQNLALALALAGQWQAARVVAAADMAPAEVDQRLGEWAEFAQPRGASDQVAALLGVRATSDAGQPVALALNAPVQVAPVAVAAVPVAEPQPVAAAAAPAPVAAPVVAAPAVATKQIAFAPMREVVQALPATTIRPAATPIKVALVGGRAVAVPAAKPVAARPAASGTWMVQLGAFDSAGVAKDAWGRATRRLPTLAQHGPSGMNIRVSKGQFYRLSVGGFSRADADTLCRRYRARGGACFVRGNAGDRVAQWLGKSGVQLASR